METKKSSEEQYITLLKFRQAFYGAISYAADSAFELLDALLVSAGLKSFPELSLSPIFHRKWSSAYSALEMTYSKQALFDLRVAQLPAEGPLLFAVDATALSRPTSFTLENRTFLHTKGDLPGTDSLTAGYAFSTIVYIPGIHSSWAVPMLQEHITGNEKAKASEKAVAQMKMVTNALPGREIVILLDSAYSNPTVLRSTIDTDTQLVVRVRPNANMYGRVAPEEQNKLGRPKLHGPKFSLSKKEEQREPDEIILVNDPELGEVRVKLWRNMHKKNCAEVEVQLICVEQLRPSTRQGRKPLWLMWVGEKMPDLRQAWKVYFQRYAVEHWYRFSKQVLHWNLPKVGKAEQIDNWNEIVVTAMWVLWLSREIVPDQPRPWQKKQAVGEMTPGRVKMGMSKIIEEIGQPTKEVKPRGKSPGWPKGKQRTKREVFAVLKSEDGRSHKKKEAA